MNFDLIARICHDANRLWASCNGDDSIASWNDASEHIRQSARNGVQFVIDNPNLGPAEQHQQWMDYKIADGWTYGPVKDEIGKTHPCLVPYDELPLTEQFKDALFRTIVLSSLGLLA